MAKPTTPSLRGTFLIKTEATKISKKNKKKLLVKQNRSSGRNSHGRITVRHRGGGAKRSARIIAFKQKLFDIPGVIESIDYDPNRNVPLSLVKYENGEIQYNVQVDSCKIGDTIQHFSSNPEIKPGNSALLKDIPSGTNVCCVELRPGSSASLARSAGTYATIAGKEAGTILIKMPSGRKISLSPECRATIGSIANKSYSNTKFGKAGRKRLMRFRPSVRGVAMNPVDHPHGGGEGKTSGGRHPCTPWGKPTKGFKTVRNKK